MRRLYTPAQYGRSLLYLVTGALLWPVMVAVVVFVGIFGLIGVPLLAIGVGWLERRRLAMLGGGVPADPHRDVVRSGPSAWIRVRYTELATWRETGHLLVFATVGGMLDMLMVSTVVALLVGAVAGQAVQGFWADAVAAAAFLVGWLALLPVVALGRGWLARALLTSDAEQGIRELARSRARLVDAFDVERRRIERDLHDGAQQRLTALTMTLGLAAVEARQAPEPVRLLVAQATEEARAVLAELRDLIRGIHPQVLTDHGLAAAIAELADRSAVPVSVELDLPGRLPSTVETTAYFVVAEALTNVGRHARAGATVIHGGLSGDRLVLEVRDDGTGGADPTRGSGLAGLADRVSAIDGSLTLSSPLGGPTVLRLEVPCSAS